jgi:type III pantothenate kinase
MKLCLDVGNSQIYGGVFDGDSLLLKFRHETHRSSTSDQLGIFLKSVLRENGIDTELITHIAISSVVPPLNYSLGSACIKYFEIEPFWIQAGVKTGLKLKVKHPNEVGADLIATAIAAVEQFPEQDLIVVDFGTATTYVPINKDKEFLGAVIQSGIRTSMHALQTFTEQLPTVQIMQLNKVVGRDTTRCIQSGLYFGQLGAAKEIIAGISKEAFPDSTPVVIATGGFSSLYEKQTLFTVIVPDLVLNGIRLALELNLSDV